MSQEDEELRQQNALKTDTWIFNDPPFFFFYESDDISFDKCYIVLTQCTTEYLGGPIFFKISYYSHILAMPFVLASLLFSVF